MNVLAIGAQRTATSWLWRQLQGYPEVQRLPFKETVFFSDAFESVSALTAGSLRDDDIGDYGRAYWTGPTRNLKAYQALFDRSFPIRADFSPSYAELPELSVRGISQMLGPDVKIILSIRDPVDRAWSNLRCDHAGDTSILTRSFAQRVSHYRSMASRRRCDYHSIYETWSRYFEQLHVIIFDDIVSDPERAIAGLESFLGLAPRAYGAQAPVNAASAEDMPREDRAFLFGMHQDVFDACEALFGGSVRRWRARNEELLAT